MFLHRTVCDNNQIAGLRLIARLLEGVAISETHSAGAVSGHTVAVPELLGGVTGEIGELELAGI